MKTIIITILILIPQVTLAAWWNPLDWFSTPTTVEYVASVCEPEVVEKIVEVEKVVYATTTETLVESVPYEVPYPVEVIKEVEIIKEIPVETVIEVPADNSHLLDRISFLEDRNRTLQATIDALEKEKRDNEVVISDVTVTEGIGNVLIQWETNVPTKAQVYVDTIGLPTEIYNSNRLSSERETAHDLGISGLHSSVKYTFRIVAESGKDVEEYEGTFTPE